MKKIIALFMATALTLSLMACGSSSTATETEESAKTEAEAGEPAKEEETSEAAPLKIGFACDDLNTDFQGAVSQGLKSRCEELGIEYEIADAAKDSNLQTSQVENMITNGCQAIIMTIYDLSACGPACAACEEAGIPLIVLDNSPHEGFYYTTSIVFDLQEISEAKANAIVDALDGKGRVYMLLGPLAQEMWSIEADIAREIFAQYPDIEIIDEQTGENYRDKSLVVMENWISTGEHFDAVWCSSDASAIGAGTACQEAGIDAFIIGQAGQPEGIQAIQDGIMDWTIYAPGSALGAGGVDAAYKIVVEGETMEKTTCLPLEFVTAENVEDYAK